MSALRHSVVLPVDAALAFSWVTDPELLPRWMGGLAGLRWGRLPPDAVGRSFVVERSWGSRMHRHPADILVWEPPRRVDWRILQDQLTVDRATTLQAQADGTLVAVELNILPVTLTARAGMPWFRREAWQRLHAELDRLRRVVEAEQG